MAEPPIPNDTYDPCATYVELREAHKQVLLGGVVRSVRFRNGEEEHQTDFGPVNVTALEKALAQAKAECEFSLNPNARPRRSAIGIGFRGPIITRPY